MEWVVYLLIKWIRLFNELYAIAVMHYPQMDPTGHGSQTAAPGDD